MAHRSTAHQKCVRPPTGRLLAPTMANWRCLDASESRASLGATHSSYAGLVYRRQIPGKLSLTYTGSRLEGSRDGRNWP
jgi:hypothetical protein